MCKEPMESTQPFMDEAKEQINMNIHAEMLTSINPWFPG